MCNSSGFPGNNSVDQAVSNSEICLALPPESWDKRCMPPLHSYYLFKLSYEHISILLEIYIHMYIQGCDLWIICNTVLNF